MESRERIAEGDTFNGFELLHLVRSKCLIINTYQILAMKCEACGSEITVYELYPRSYRLYIYLCKKCRGGFLAHHFDLDLEIYQMEKVKMKQSGKLFFLHRLKFEPRVFDFKLEEGQDAIVVVDDEISLGELVKNKGYHYAPYSPKATKRLCRHLGDSEYEKLDEAELAAEVGKAWESAK